VWSSPHLSPTPSLPNCHPERSEGSSGYLPREMLHFVQHDSGERSGSTPCGHRHISRRPHPRPIVILNEVKDPPAACPERCFTSFSMTKVNDRGRLRVVAATSLRPPTPRPVVILNEVKDLPAAWPERCFTSFSMTVMDSRDRRRHHHPLTHPYRITTLSLALRPNTSGEYISSALAGGTTNSPGVVARAT
jgi:hypothetical protein